MIKRILLSCLIVFKISAGLESKIFEYAFSVLEGAIAQTEAIIIEASNDKLLDLERLDFYKLHMIGRK